MTFDRTVDRLLKPDTFKLGKNGVRMYFRDGKARMAFKSGHRTNAACKWRKLIHLQHGRPLFLDLVRVDPF